MKYVLYVIYLALLAVLLPHTAYAFSLMEPSDGELYGWAAAFVFEAAIAVLTHILAEQLSDSDDGTVRWKHMVSVPAMLLYVVIIVSVIANWTHAFYFVTIEETNRIFLLDTFWARLFYSTVFGAILPLCSFGFAFVLSKVYRDERLKGKIAEIELINLVLSDPGRITPMRAAKKIGVQPTQIDELMISAKRMILDNFKIADDKLMLPDVVSDSDLDEPGKS